MGAWLTEFEFQRYQPRPAFTALLNQYDLIQVVGGSPAWAAAALAAQPPVCAFAATTAAQERHSILKQTRGARRLWLTAMTYLTTKVERHTLPRLACVFPESEYTRTLFAPYVAPQRLRVAPPGVDADFFHPAPTYHADGPILCVGRLNDPRKNLPLLLHAYHQLRQRLATAPKLVLVSQEPLAPTSLALIDALGLRAHVDIRINLSLDELRHTYQTASLFVLSSDEEGLGIVILEAMACGLPVISTDCGGPATALLAGKTGHLTPTAQILPLADAMVALISAPALRATMSTAARQRAEQRFSLQAAGKVYLDAYDELLLHHR
jgi:glycosyltransferase involved in cell wall biosynthesis